MSDVMNGCKGESEEKRYALFVCILAIEGPYDDDLLRRMLTDANRTFQQTRGPFRSRSLWDHDEDIALVTFQPMQVRVYNGKAHLTQRLTNVYVASGTVTEAEVAAMRARKDRLVDFCGHVEIIRRDTGVPLGMSLKGRAQEQVACGNIILVEKAGIGEEPETYFEVINSEMPPVPLQVSGLAN